MTFDNPWTTLKSEQKYDNPWIRVDEHQVLNPNGNPGIYGVVTFKNLAIGIVPLDDEGNTYLVGQYRFPLNAYSWEIPEGGGPVGKDPLESAQRELREETGYTASRWQMIGKIHTSNSVCNEEGYLYLAEGLTAGETEFEDTEQLTLRKLPLTEAVDMVMRGEITDSLSIAGILKVAKLKGL